MKLSINQEIFNHIICSPQYCSSGDLTFQYRGCDKNYIGFILPRRLGAAYKRNKFKRQCRSLCQLMNKNIPSRSVGIIVKTKSIDVSYKEINIAFMKLGQIIL